VFVLSNIHVAPMVELRLQHWRTPRQDTRAVQTLAGAVRYTELQPTGSETSDTDRQSEIVAAINGPICCGLEAKKLNHFSRACACVCVLGLRRGRPHAVAGCHGRDLETRETELSKILNVFNECVLKVLPCRVTQESMNAGNAHN
jgi:hypothetical protein